MNKVSAQLNQFRRISGVAGISSASRVFLWKLLGRRQPVSVRIGDVDIRVRLGTPDLGVALSSLGDEYSPLRYVLPRNFAGLIVDAGGYIGSAAIQLARMYPKAVVVTIEPAASNFEILAVNVRSYPNIVPIKAALVAEPCGPIALASRESGPWGFTTVRTDGASGDGGGHVEETATITLQEIRDRQGALEIGILKLDIEGAERELFLKARAELDTIRAVFVELHDRIADGCSAAFEVFSRERVVANFGGEKFLSIQKHGARGAPHLSVTT